MGEVVEGVTFNWNGRARLGPSLVPSTLNPSSYLLAEEWVEHACVGEPQEHTRRGHRTLYLGPLTVLYG